MLFDDDVLDDLHQVKQMAEVVILLIQRIEQVQSIRLSSDE